jgi:hypothetical protein
MAFSVAPMNTATDAVLEESIPDAKWIQEERSGLIERCPSCTHTLTGNQRCK